MAIFHQQNQRHGIKLSDKEVKIVIMKNSMSYKKKKKNLKDTTVISGIKLTKKKGVFYQRG